MVHNRSSFPNLMGLTMFSLRPVIGILIDMKIGLQLNDQNRETLNIRERISKNVVFYSILNSRACYVLMVKGGGRLYFFIRRATVGWLMPNFSAIWDCFL